MYAREGGEMANEVGKVEYAPDYKSPSQRLAVLRAEHERLRSAVVEAAQMRSVAQEQLKHSDNVLDFWKADNAIYDAVDVLNEFEASHTVEQKDSD